MGQRESACSLQIVVFKTKLTHYSKKLAKLDHPQQS